MVRLGLFYVKKRFDRIEAVEKDWCGGCNPTLCFSNFYLSVFLQLFVSCVIVRNRRDVILSFSYI